MEWAELVFPDGVIVEVPGLSKTESRVASYNTVPFPCSRQLCME